MAGSGSVAAVYVLGVCNIEQLWIFGFFWGVTNENKNFILAKLIEIIHGFAEGIFNIVKL